MCVPDVALCARLERHWPEPLRSWWLHQHTEMCYNRAHRERQLAVSLRGKQTPQNGVLLQEIQVQVFQGSLLWNWSREPNAYTRNWHPPLQLGQVRFPMSEFAVSKWRWLLHKWTKWYITHKHKHTHTHTLQSSMVNYILHKLRDLNKRLSVDFSV